MRVAIITGGQPRFTQDFVTVLNQLKGFDTADLYVNLWESDWVDTVDLAWLKISKILPSNVRLKKLEITKQPERILPSTLSPNRDELKWWYDRRIGQIHALKLAVDLVTDLYDIIIRVRPDGCLDTNLDISSLDLVNNEVIFCHNLIGAEQNSPNDQFFVGTQEGIKFLCNLYTDFDQYMFKTYPQWEHNVHEWALEHIIRIYFQSNGKHIYRGNFNHDINRSGKSAYSDKHPHLYIAKDPTV